MDEAALKQNVDIDAGDGAVIAAAVGSGKPQMLAELFDQGADPMAGKGRALDLALNKEKPDFLQQFIDAGVPSTHIRGRAAMMMRKEPMALDEKNRKWMLALLQGVADEAKSADPPIPRLPRHKRERVQSLQTERRRMLGIKPSAETK
jgi:hypothetical protein